MLNKEDIRKYLYEIYEVLNDNELSFKNKGDGVFKVKVENTEKIILIHSWCDCGN